MGLKFEILAAHYPFKGYYEDSLQCTTLWVALKQFIKYQKQGYDLIHVYYRDIKPNNITWAFIDEEG